MQRMEDKKAIDAIVNEEIKHVADLRKMLLEIL